MCRMLSNSFVSNFLLQLDSLDRSSLASRLTLNCMNSYIEPQKIANIPMTIIDVRTQCFNKNSINVLKRFPLCPNFKFELYISQSYILLGEVYNSIDTDKIKCKDLLSICMFITCLCQYVYMCIYLLYMPIYIHSIHCLTA